MISNIFVLTLAIFSLLSEQQYQDIKNYPLKSDFSSCFDVHQHPSLLGMVYMACRLNANGSIVLAAMNLTTLGISYSVIGGSWSSNTQIKSLDIDPISGDVFACGYTTVALFGQKGNLGSQDIFLFRMSSNLSLIWVRVFGSFRSDVCVKTLYDHKNSILYIAGSYGSSITTNNFNEIYNGGRSDFIVCGYSNDGDRLWAKLSGSNGDDNLYDMVLFNGTDPTIFGIDGSLYVLSAFRYNGTGSLVVSQQTSLSSLYQVFSACYSQKENRIYLLVYLYNNHMQIASLFADTLMRNNSYIINIQSTATEYSGTMTLSSTGDLIVSGTTTGYFIGFSQSAGNNNVFLMSVSTVYGIRWIKELNIGNSNTISLISSGDGKALLWTSAVTNSNLVSLLTKIDIVGIRPAIVRTNANDTVDISLSFPSGYELNLNLTTPLVYISNRKSLSTYLLDSSNIRAVVPVAAGINNSVAVDFSVSGYPIMLTSPFSLSYFPPIVLSASPSNGPLSGNYYVQFSVSNLGDPYLDSVSVSIGPNSCKNIIQLSSNLISCLVPPSKCAGKQSVIVTVNFQSSLGFYFQYNNPIITSLSTLTGSTDGGDTIMLNGQNFGAALPECSKLTVFFSVYECTNVLILSDTQISCTTSPGIGSDLPLFINLNTETLQYDIYFSYLRPTVSSVSPRQGLWNVGTKISILGTEIGSFSSDIQVLLTPIKSSTYPAINVPGSWISMNEIIAVLPSTYNSMTQYSIQIVVGAQISDAKNPPFIISIFPKSDFDVLGNEVLNIYGSFFTNDTDSKIYVDSNLCLAINFISETNMTCVTPGGIGKNLEVSVVISGFESQRNSFFSYRAPEVYSISPSQSLTGSGDLLTIIGSEFGPYSSGVLVFFNSFIRNISALPCPSSMYVSKVMITCLMPSLPLEYQRDPYYISVVVGGQHSISVSAVFQNKDSSFIKQVPPIASNFSVDVLENSMKVIQLQGKDITGLAIGFYIKSLPLFGKIYQKSSDVNSLGGEITSIGSKVLDDNFQIVYVPDLNYYGEDIFSFYVINEFNLISLSNAFVNITVLHLNQPPYFSIMESLITLSMNESINPIVLPIFDVDESQFFTILSDSQYIRGIWSQGKGNIINISSFEIPVSNKVIFLQHDQLGGGNPYSILSFRGVDSYNLSSANNFTLKIVVSCPVNLVNNIWANGPVCLPCPDGGICSQSGSFPPINSEGYYVLGNGTFVPCDPPIACPQASFSNGEFKCAAGYNGLRCGQCDLDYYRFGSSCIRCTTYNIPTWGVVLLAIVCIVIIVIVLNYLRRLDIGFFNILITFLQTVAIFGTFKFPWPQSLLSLYNFFSFANLNIQIASPECFIIHDNRKSYEFKYLFTFYTIPALLAIILMLVAVTELFSMFKSTDFGRKIVTTLYDQVSKIFPTKEDNSPKLNYGVPKAESYVVGILPRTEFFSKSIALSQIEFPEKITHVSETSPPGASTLRRSNREQGAEGSNAAGLLIVFLLALKYLYLNVSKSALELFECTYYPGSGYFFAVEPNRRCYVEEWWKNLLPYSVVGIVLYVIGIPLLFIFLPYERHRICSIPPEERNWYHRIILQVTFKKNPDFREEFEYWDVIIFIRKLGMVASQMFFSGYPSFQLVLLVVVFYAAYSSQREFKPYTLPSMNTLEGITLLCCMTISLSGMVFLNSQFPESYNEAIAIIVVLMIVASSLCIFLATLMHIQILKNRLFKP